ncbi:MAG: hypothetical protein EP332_11090 [Bacteroidetes bacterium]|nr:MAG: hypothetical protein EP332_11090 [Bacteroidota bacterium]
MTLKNISLSLLMLSFIACKDQTPETDNKQVETQEESVKGTDLLSAYADTLTQVADSLENVYNSAISEAARMPDSVRVIEVKYKMLAGDLDKRLVDLNESIHKLLLDRKVTEEEYQQITMDIDLTGVSAALDKLKLMGLNLFEENNVSEKNADSQEK